MATGKEVENTVEALLNGKTITKDCCPDLLRLIEDVKEGKLSREEFTEIVRKNMSFKNVY
jgi:hypothetical protein